MQYTTKFAFLAAVFGATAFAVPLGHVDYQLEAREADNYLVAREFHDRYLEARANPELDARDIEALDLEAREYLEYLEARDAAAQPTPDATTPPPAGGSVGVAADAQAVVANEKTNSKTTTTTEVSVDKSIAAAAVSASASASASAPASSPSASSPGSEPPATHPGDHHHHHHHHHHPHHHYHWKPSKAQREELADPTALEAALEDEDSSLHRAAVYIKTRQVGHQELEQFPELDKEALADKYSPLHRLAVKKALSDPAELQSALADSSSPLHEAAERHERKQKVQAYLEDKANFEAALHDDSSEYHHAAVHRYLSDEEHFHKALHHRHSLFHKAAVRMYLANPEHLERALYNKHSRFHRAAKHIMRHRLRHHHHHHHHHHHEEVEETGDEPATSTESVPCPSSTASADPTASDAPKLVRRWVRPFP